MTDYESYQRFPHKNNKNTKNDEMGEKPYLIRWSQSLGSTIVPSQHHLCCWSAATRIRELRVWTRVERRAMENVGKHIRDMDGYARERN
nr:hypothetical protein Iba_chr04bCG18230 [Ipomoea batatas]